MMLSNMGLCMWDDRPSLHVGTCSLGLAGQQLCRKGPGLPTDNKRELAVRLCSDEGKLGCISEA